MEGDEDINGRGDESFEMGDVRLRMGGLGVVDENDGEVGVEREVEMMQMDAMVESDDEVEYMPPKVVGESPSPYFWDQTAHHLQPSRT